MEKLTKKEICLNNEAFAYYSGLGGLELHYIDYGIEDHVYCASGSWHGKKSYHKLKIYYGEDTSYYRLKIYRGEDIRYIKLNGHKIPLGECIRM